MIGSIQHNLGKTNFSINRVTVYIINYTVKVLQNSAYI